MKKQVVQETVADQYAEGKRIMAIVKKHKHWHHDIQFIDGVYVEDVAMQYQKTHDEQLLVKIIENWAVFRPLWATAFAQYLDNDLEAGAAMHDNIIWKTAAKFDYKKSKKAKGKAFNAFIVSSLMNQLKNFWNAKNSRKNTPRVTCPICKEEVVLIDAKHLSHTINLERYKKQFPGYPLVSTDGLVACPLSDQYIDEITEEHIIKKTTSEKYYTIQDYYRENADKLPRYPIKCPVTGVMLNKVTANYPSALMRGYTEEAFIKDFPNWEGIINCPITKSKILEMTQDRLDKELSQELPIYGKKEFLKDYPNFTTKAMQTSVQNPYTKKWVLEITPEMLLQAGTTVKEHLEKFATIILGQHYKTPFNCPFTGRKTNCITKQDLQRLGRTVQEFYQVTCKYPLRKFLVQCAIDGEWVENIWTHLQENPHQYAQPISVEDFENRYGTKCMRAHITNNSYVETDNGDSIHVADLLGGARADDYLDVEDSLLQASSDDFDKKIARSVRSCNSVDDICHRVAQKIKMKIPVSYKTGMSRVVKTILENKLKHCDFDISKLPEEGANDVEILIPSKNTISIRLAKMLMRSDLEVSNVALNTFSKTLKEQKNKKAHLKTLV